MLNTECLGKLCLLRNCTEVVVLTETKQSLYFGTVINLATGKPVTTHLWNQDGTAVELCVVEDVSERDIIKVNPAKADIHNARIQLVTQKVKELLESEGFTPQFGSITLHDTFTAYPFEYTEPVRRILNFKPHEILEDEDDYLE